MATGDTFKTYSGDGVTTDFAIPFAYDDASTEVVVTRKNGAVTYIYVNAATIRITSPAVLAVGDSLTIQRVTNIDTAKVTFKNGSATTGGQLNSMVTQLIRSAQEVKDLVLNALYKTTSGVFDALNLRITNVGAPTLTTDAARLADVQAAQIAAANVPTPVLGQVGYYLKATAAGAFAWFDAATTFLSRSNNLSDVANAATARTNIGAAATNANISGFTQDVNFSLRNRIINGDMRVSQRNGTTTAIATTVGQNYGGPDRWALVTSQTSKLNVTQFNLWSSSPSPYNPWAIVITNGATTYTALAADYFTYEQRIEGLNVADLAWGTLQAKPVTISFYAWSNVAGTYALSVNNSAANRSYVTTFTLAASTNTLVTVTIPGDTSGSWLTDNGIGLKLAIDLGSGSNLNAASLNTWNGAAATRHSSTVSNFTTQASSLFRLTDVQLEAGSVATPFERRPYTTELHLCQRYFYHQPFNINFSASAGTAAYECQVNWPATMRATPTAGVIGVDPAGSAGSVNNASNVVQRLTPYGGTLALTATAAGQTFVVGYRSAISAEL